MLILSSLAAGEEKTWYVLADESIENFSCFLFLWNFPPSAFVRWWQSFRSPWKYLVALNCGRWVSLDKLVSQHQGGKRPEFSIQYLMAYDLKHATEQWLCRRNPGGALLCPPTWPSPCIVTTCQREMRSHLKVKTLSCKGKDPPQI